MGLLNIKIADMIADGPIIRKARSLAKNIIDEDPLLDKHTLIKKRVLIDYKERLELIKLN